MKWKLFLPILAIVFLLGCSGQTTDIAIPQESPEQKAAGQEFKREILDLLQGHRGWMPPLPPAGGQKPRILTEEEKNRILEVANSVPQVIEANRHPDVVSVETWYLWVGWIGHANGVAYVNYGPIESGTKDLSKHEDAWFPAVKFIFNSKFGVYGRCGYKIAVNLETGKVVRIGGFSGTPIPRKELTPPWHER